MRNQIINVLRTTGHAVQETTQGVSALEDAKAMFICNALMRIVPVNSVSRGSGGAYHFDAAPVHALLRQLDRFGYE